MGGKLKSWATSAPKLILFIFVCIRNWFHARCLSHYLVGGNKYSSKVIIIYFTPFSFFLSMAWWLGTPVVKNACEDLNSACCCFDRSLIAHLCQQVQSKKKTVKDAGAQQWISPSLSCKGSWEIQFSNPLSSLTQPTSDRKAPATPAVTRVRIVVHPMMLPWMQSSLTHRQPRRTCRRSPMATPLVWRCTSPRPSFQCSHSSPMAQLTVTGLYGATGSTAFCQGRELS